MPNANPVVRFITDTPPEVAAEIRKRAAEEGISRTKWVVRAMRAALEAEDARKAQKGAGK